MKIRGKDRRIMSSKESQSIVVPDITCVGIEKSEFSGMSITSPQSVDAFALTETCE